MSSPLHQITMSYMTEEDRILFRISTTEQSEYQLWLTRRFVKVLWGALMQTMEKNPELRDDLMPEVRDAILAMQHQEAVQEADFGSTHSKGNRDLTSNTGPLLVTGGSVTPVNADLTRLSLTTDTGTAINFGLNKQLMHAFCHLVVTTSIRAEWDLAMSVGDSNVVAPDKTKVH